MSRKLMGIALAIGLLVVPLSAWAGDKGAGCGLGKVLLEGNSGFMSHSTALTSNAAGGGVVDSQVLGVTVGTSGCDANKAVDGRDAERGQFVAINLDNLSQDMAVGSGEYLHSLASLMGCNTAAYAEFGQMTRDHYVSLMDQADVSSDQMIVGLGQRITANPVLASGCSRVS